MLNFLVPPDASSAEVISAKQFFSEFVPCMNDTQDEHSEECFRLALEYARQEFQQATGTFDALDGKAEKLFQFSAALSAGVMTAGKALELQFSGWLLGSFAGFCTVMLLAMWIRQPLKRETPASTAELLEHANNMPPGYLMGKLAASFNIATVSTRSLCDWKATVLRWTQFAFIVSIMSMAFGVWAQ
ncbi:hypothetical protein [Planctomicrobium sp. SH527]|uniref:hypothetical protein n=1 Tax=Planctomicrobium sp. SH527 TaxID=3448123 RepID=UPI003F5C5BBE